MTGNTPESDAKKKGWEKSDAKKWCNENHIKRCTIDRWKPNRVDSSRINSMRLFSLK
jgi:hypothetical protein